MDAETKCPECGDRLPLDAVEGLCPRCLLSRAQTRATTQGSGGDSPHPDGLPRFEELAGLFPQLEILEILGQGGMGVVYKARQTKLGRFVALKILTQVAATKPHFPERFAREAQALARLNHPGIVGIHDFGQNGDIYYLIMEYVDGANLRSVIQSKSLTSSNALDVVTQICEALQYAHDQGIVHRDIKPGNILLDKRGRAKIADFGLAKLFDEGADKHALTASHQVMGTPHYMAPEQIDHPLEVDHRADIYSLGVVFYEMLTGELPLGRFAVPSKKVQIDVRLDEVVLRSLESSPERRYQRVGDVKTDVDRISSTSARSGASRGETQEPPPRAVDAQGLWRVAALTLGSYLVVVLLTAIWLQFRLGQTRAATRELEAEWQNLRPDSEKAVRQLGDYQEAQRQKRALDWFQTNRFLWSPVLGAIPFSTGAVRVVQFDAQLSLLPSPPLRMVTNLLVRPVPRSWWQLGVASLDSNLVHQLVSTAESNLAVQPALAGHGLRFSTNTFAAERSDGLARIELTAHRKAFVTEQPIMRLRLHDHSMPAGDATDGFLQALQLPKFQTTLLERTLRPEVDSIVGTVPFIRSYVEIKAEPSFRSLP